MQKIKTVVVFRTLKSGFYLLSYTKKKELRSIEKKKLFKP